MGCPVCPAGRWRVGRPQESCPKPCTSQELAPTTGLPASQAASRVSPGPLLAISRSLVPLVLSASQPVKLLLEIHLLIQGPLPEASGVASLCKGLQGQTPDHARIRTFRASQPPELLAREAVLEPIPNPNLTPVCSGQVQLVQGLQASKQEASSQTQPNFAPAWSRQVHKTNKKTGTRSEFERTLNP